METNFQLKQDELGKFISVVVDTEIYSVACLMKTCYWYTEDFYIFLNWKEKPLLEISFRTKNDRGDSELLGSAQDFINRLIDESVRDFVSKETKIIKEVIVKKAFTEALTDADRKLIKKWETQ